MQSEQIEESKEVTKTRPKLAAFILDEIQKAGNRESNWHKEADEINERYRSEKDGTGGRVSNCGRRFNILWSNIELLKPAVLSRTPQPDVRRRFLDEDPIGRICSKILERALAFCADDPHYNFRGVLNKVRDDSLLAGRGVPRLIYERDINRKKLFAAYSDPDEYGQQFNLGVFHDEEGNQYDDIDGEDDEGPYREEIGRQDVYCTYVYRKDYREGDARCWDDVPWVAYRHRLTREELREQFGSKASLVKMGDDERDDDNPENPFKKATVWEVWVKAKRKRIWVAEGLKDDVLDIEDDPLELADFFPQPNPLFSITTNDTRLPVPEFRLYKAQADEINEYSKRISVLMQALKVRGVYPAVLKEMGNILEGEENELFPYQDWQALQQAGGLEKMISWVPIEQIIRVIIELRNQREAVKQEVYELTGISDILRGATDPRETKGAQQIKASFGTVRLTPRTEPMEMMARDIFRLKGEIIAKHFTAENLIKMTGVEVPAQMLGDDSQDMEQQDQLEQITMDDIVARLRDDDMRAYTIDIESDSTVAPDQQREQANVAEFTNTLANFLAQALPLAQQSPQMVPLLLSLLKAIVRRFKLGREVEDEVNKATDQIMKAAKQSQLAPPQPSPEEVAAQKEMEREDARFQAEERRKDLTLVHDIERQKTETQADIAIQAQAQENSQQLQGHEFVHNQFLKGLEVAGQNQ